MYKYSVVIPHYNSAELLRRMLASIPEREDIQVIIADDGSNIENVEILKTLTHKNLDILFLEHVNSGHARNKGLERAEGKYFIAADADDEFAPKAFEIFDKYTGGEEIDCLFFCMKVINSDGTEKNVKILGNESVKAYLKNANHNTEIRIKFRNMNPVNKLVKMSFIREHNIKFEVNGVNDDTFYTYQIGLHVKNFKVIPDALYYITENPSSITRQKRSIEREFEFYLCRQKQNGFYRKLGLKQFIRPDILYVPYMIFKHGITGAIKFFRLLWQHRDERAKARRAYLCLFDENMQESL